ncbi:CDP-diacylglycerol--glycerol-3-phosphate 3-phosphatidyltransferase, mitochondrial isoform X4 [Periplaneta americana]
MLLPLLNKYKDLCQVSLYHTPVLRGLLHRLMPERYNEVLGLQHMKVYLFDDSLLISGANLSNDYFTNRQDRYVLIEDCGPLADFYDGLVSRVSEFSLQLDQGDQVHLHSSWKYHPYKGKKGEFKSAAKDRVWSYISSTMTQQQNHGISGTGDTWIFPLVEMGQLGLHQDSCVTKKMFETALPGSIIHLATGYFNLTQEYTISIINHSAASFNILMAHPTANGFLGAQGPAGGIPAAYTLLASAFFKQQQISGQEQRIQMAEFQKKGWTYHAKGLWYTLPGQNLPILTLVGSPNFGNRSVCRDLETQIAIVTKNPKLQQNLLEERERLYASSTPFTSETLSQPDRKYAPLWVHMAVRLFRNLL